MNYQEFVRTLPDNWTDEGQKKEDLLFIIGLWITDIYENDEYRGGLHSALGRLIIPRKRALSLLRHHAGQFGYEYSKGHYIASKSVGRKGDKYCGGDRCRQGKPTLIKKGKDVWPEKD